jgi:murein DD-endopeptidase MepM/ murein hydrolase activator NlpD
MLPQKPAPRTRKIKLRHFVVWSALPLLGLVAAFGVMPQSMTLPASKTHTVVQEVTLPQIAPAGNASTYWRYDRVQKGDTVAGLLNRLSVEDSVADSYLRTSSPMESFRKLATGRAVQAETAADGTLLALRYADNSGSQVLVERAGSSFAVRTLPAQLESRLFMRTGVIKTGLFEAADAAGLPEPAANQLADIFSGDIDFHHELKPGDKFAVIYEVSYSNGEPAHVGRILAAEIVVHGIQHRAFYFQNGEESGYFSPEGYSMQRTFLRSPMEFTRISSDYSSSRFHPILHKWKAHKGVDYAAPIGTRVKCTAAGTVEFVGQQTGYGNLVIIKHDGRFSTAYGHLSRFASHLRTGQHIAQGEVIGYVGQTGWATGPHLHYEFRVDGKQRNPSNMPTTGIPSINDGQRSAFLEATRDLNTRLAILHNINLAQID